MSSYGAHMANEIILLEIIRHPDILAQWKIRGTV